MSKNSNDLLYDVVKNMVGDDSVVEFDPKTLRYVIYARKSTTQEERQEQSIPAQIKECLNRVVKPEGLNVVEIIEEKGSAKEPDIRPKFSKMIDDLKTGLIDGIITWHPDRLSRNMKEAGEIIDFLDKRIIKDLRFATSTFENNSTGKMLLGISFVMSKQYSENLSTNVLRGNKIKTEGGIFVGHQKHGYYISEAKLYPDGNNFVIIQEAFKKRIEGLSQQDIAKWLNTTNYTLKPRGKEPKAYKWDKDAVSNLLKDPTNAGVLKYGRNVVKLNEYYDFEPVISEEDFFKVNKVHNFTSKKLISSQRATSTNKVKANLLRGIVICGSCSKPFSSGITSKKQTNGTVKQYYYYKCETVGCEIKKKNVRAKVPVEVAIEFLNGHLFTTRENYDNYVQEAKSISIVRDKELLARQNSLVKQLTDKQKELKSTKELLRKQPNLVKHYDLDLITTELNSIAEDLKSVKQDRDILKTTHLTYRKYLELFANIGGLLKKTKSMDYLDQVLRKFFSNFVITDGSVSGFSLNEPWEGFIYSDNFVNGRGERTRTFDLLVPNQAR